MQFIMITITTSVYWPSCFHTRRREKLRVSNHLVQSNRNQVPPLLKNGLFEPTWRIHSKLFFPCVFALSISPSKSSSSSAFLQHHWHDLLDPTHTVTSSLHIQCLPFNFSFTYTTRTHLLHPLLPYQHLLSLFRGKGSAWDEEKERQHGNMVVPCQICGGINFESRLPTSLSRTLSLKLTPIRYIESEFTNVRHLNRQRIGSERLSQHSHKLWLYEFFIGLFFVYVWGVIGTS